MKQKFLVNSVSNNFSNMSASPSGSKSPESAVKSLSSVINELPHARPISKILTVEQMEKLMPHIETPVLKAVIKLLREAEIPFIIAGSFAGYALGMVEVYKDLDLFISASSASDIPGFQATLREADITVELDYAILKGLQVEEMPIGWQSQYQVKHGLSKDEFNKLFYQKYDDRMIVTEVDFEANVRKLRRYRRDLTQDIYDAAHEFGGSAKRLRKMPPAPKNPKRLEIHDVIKLKPLIGLNVDLVFAPSNVVKDTFLYAVFVIRHFDMQQARVALFNPSFDQPDNFHSVDLIYSTWDDAMPERLAKYEGRSMKVTPSSLNMLSIHAMLSDKQVEIKDEAPAAPEDQQ